MDGPIRILFLEDLEDDVDLIKRALHKEGMKAEIMQVDERGDYEKSLTDFGPHIILSDHALPQFNSIEALEIKNKIMPDVPFILVTGAVSEEFAAQCIKLGADDYVLKTNLTRLPNAISAALEAREMEQKRKEYTEAIRVQNIELIKINKEMDSFIYSVSHNLRSPLSSVLGLINIAKLEKINNPEQGLQYLDMIKKSIDRLDNTIKEMLDYSQNARIEVSYSAVDIRKLFDECLHSLEYMDEFNQVRKEFIVSGESILFTDKHRLTIILTGLLSNSIRFFDSEKKDPYVRVKVHLAHRDVSIAIEDNGIGIKQEYLHTVFDMFYRATEVSDGAGLGLFIIKEIIDKLEAFISLTSRFGEGTTVIMKLPNHIPD
jgi:signal transduction histidine kinase